MVRVTSVYLVYSQDPFLGAFGRSSNRIFCFCLQVHGKFLFFSKLNFIIMGIITSQAAVGCEHCLEKGKREEVVIGENTFLFSFSLYLYHSCYQHGQEKCKHLPKIFHFLFSIFFFFFYLLLFFFYFFFFSKLAQIQAILHSQHDTRYACIPKRKDLNGKNT